MAGNRPYDDDDLDREGIPDLETPLNQDEGIVAPGDRPKAADDYGVTAAEQRRGEPIAERVTREVPDPTSDDLDVDDADRSYEALARGNGRIVEPGSEDVDRVDDEKDAVGTMYDDEGAPSAEEAAMHITDQP